MRFILTLALIVLTGCATVPPSPPSGAQAPSGPRSAVDTSALSSRQAAQQFVQVIDRMEPVAERECRARSQGLNCDFLIVIDDRPGQGPNAFMTLDMDGRPILAFNIPLIASVRNPDELAFVVGHEAAHHIANHIERQRRNAMTGAVLLGGLASLSGADAGAVRNAQEIGATVGARTYSKEFELEADALGTVIAARAGYDPVRGAEFFNRIPDPGNRFLGTHPPNAQRIATVRRVAAGL